MRFHALTAVVSLLSSEEDTHEELVALLLVAKHCQEARRAIQKECFPNLTERHWCMVKSASTLLQLLGEVGDSLGTENLVDVKNIVDESILVTTGEDISGCEACREDKK